MRLRLLQSKKKNYLNVKKQLTQFNKTSRLLNRTLRKQKK